MKLTRLPTLWPGALVVGLFLVFVLVDWLLPGGWRFALLALAALVVALKVILDLEKQQAQIHDLEGQRQQQQDAARKAREESAELKDKLAAKDKQLAKTWAERNEAQFLLDGARQALIGISADGRIDSWNPEAERSFQFADPVRGELLSQTLVEVAVLDGWLAERPSEPKFQDVAVNQREFALCLSPTADADGRYVVSLTEIRGQQRDQERIRLLEAERGQMHTHRLQVEEQLKKVTAGAQQWAARAQDLEKLVQERDSHLEAWQRYAGELERDRNQQVADLTERLNQTQANLAERLQLKQRVLESLEDIPNAAVIVRGNSVCWMNQRARDLFGYPLNGDLPFPPIERLLPDLKEEVRHDLVNVQLMRDCLAPELPRFVAWRRDGFRLRVLIDAVPTELMALEDAIPQEADLLLILRDATPRKVRERLRDYLCPPWWAEATEPEQPAAAEPAPVTPSAREVTAPPSPDNEPGEPVAAATPAPLPEVDLLPLEAGAATGDNLLTQSEETAASLPPEDGWNREETPPGSWPV